MVLLAIVATNYSVQPPPLSSLLLHIESLAPRYPTQDKYFNTPPAEQTISLSLFSRCSLNRSQHAAGELPAPRNHPMESSTYYYSSSPGQHLQFSLGDRGKRLLGLLWPPIVRELLFLDFAFCLLLRARVLSLHKSAWPFPTRLLLPLSTTDPQALRYGREGRL